MYFGQQMHDVVSRMASMLMTDAVLEHLLPPWTLYGIRATSARAQHVSLIWLVTSFACIMRTDIVVEHLLPPKNLNGIRATSARAQYLSSLWLVLCITSIVSFVCTFYDS
jgi:hypothetical protein